VCVLSFTLGCSGYGGAVAEAGLQPRPQADGFPGGGHRTDRCPHNHCHSSGKAANGQVQLFDGTNPLGSPTSVINGTATNQRIGVADRDALDKRTLPG